VRSLELAIKYLAGNRIIGTEAERTALTTSTPAYSTTFGSTSGWSSNDTHVFIDTANNMLEFECDDNSTDEYINYDMGAGNISNTAWVMRYEMTFRTFNMSGADVNNALVVGCLDNASPSGIVSSGDGLSYSMQVSDSAHSIANVLQAVNGGSQSKSDVNNDPFDKDDIGDYITTFYMEIKRMSADLIEQRVYTTSDYSTTQLGTTMSRSTSSAVTALRYITILLDQPSSGVGDGYTGYIQNLKFYNGMTSPNIVYPNLIAGTIWEESDTGKHYVFNTSTGWNEVVA